MFKRGDIVQHKGVLKTIGKIISDQAYCQWFVGDKLYQKWIGTHCLKQAGTK